MATFKVRTKLYPKAIREVAEHHEVQERLQQESERGAEIAALLAPKLTGAGARSIHAEKQDDGTWRFSWDVDHGYMAVQELGSEHVPPQPFLRPAAKRLEGR